MERFAETFDLDLPVDWNIPRPSQTGGWDDHECEADDPPYGEIQTQIRAFSRIRATVLITEISSTTIDRLTRMRISALEQRVAELLHEVIRLRDLLENESNVSDSNASADPALDWISKNTPILDAYIGKYVAFTSAQGIVAVAPSLKELYLLLGGRERDVNIHYVAEPLTLEDE